MTLTEQDANKEVTVKHREMFSISLQAVPSTGYIWMLAECDCIVVGEKFTADGEGIGSGGRQVFSFEACKMGSCRISLRYVRPWLNKNEKYCEFFFNVVS